MMRNHVSSWWPKQTSADRCSFWGVDHGDHWERIAARNAIDFSKHAKKKVEDRERVLVWGNLLWISFTIQKNKSGVMLALELVGKTSFCCHYHSLPINEKVHEKGTKLYRIKDVKGLGPHLSCSWWQSLKLMASPCFVDSRGDIDIIHSGIFKMSDHLDPSGYD